LRRSETWRGVSPSSSASTSCATARRCSACTSARGWGGWGSLGRGWAQPPPSSFCPGQGGDPVRLPGASQSGAAAPQPALPGGAERVLAPAAAPRQGPAVSLGVRVPRAMGVPSEVPEHPTGPWCHVTHGGSPPRPPSLAYLEKMCQEQQWLVPGHVAWPSLVAYRNSLQPQEEGGSVSSHSTAPRPHPPPGSAAKRPRVDGEAGGLSPGGPCVRGALPPPAPMLGWGGLHHSVPCWGDPSQRLGPVWGSPVQREGHGGVGSRGVAKGRGS